MAATFCYSFQLVTVALFVCIQLQMATSWMPVIAYLPIAKPGCQDNCGNVSIPYPFGIREDCYYNLQYAVTCNMSVLRSTLLLNILELEVEQISLENEGRHTIVVKTPLQKTCSIQDVNISSIDLRGTPYSFSEANAFGSSTLLLDRSDKILGGCTTVCDKTHMITSNCNGRGCCSIDLPSSLDFYRINIFNFGKDVDNCTNTMLLNMTSIMNKMVDPNLSEFAAVSTVLEWLPGNITRPANDTNKYCHGPPDNYDCSCLYGTYGNPYLPYGCQIPRECTECKIGCTKEGNQYRCVKNVPTGSNTRLVLLILLGGTIVGLMLLTGNISCIYLFIKKRRHLKMKEKFFQQNGGFLLKQQLSSNQGRSDSTKIFTTQELREATNNYSNDNILGRGGFWYSVQGDLTKQSSSCN